jgi:DNA mismatch repair protein MutL
VLPDILIDQIAAGEVVDRPASVVKELVENSLDAGATHITVEMEAGGKKRIRILDNGIGMSPEAAELALQRHATSKLRAIDDLFCMSTFGFRGEALPSIASVSKMTLTTRERDSESIAAHRLHIDGGRIVERSEVGAPVGTCIEICDLLYNVPARQKFLKGDATETSHVTDVVSKLALANPGVHFRLKNRSRTTLNAPGHTSYADRVKAVMGARLGRDAHEVSGEYGGVHVQAFLASPEVAQSTTRGLQLFVGRRAIRDRGILHAVLQGYDELVPRGRYPVAVILLEMSKGEVDINVHPQKLEVRFSDPQLVYAAVRQVVRQGVQEAGWSGMPTSSQATGQGGQLHVIAAKAPPRLFPSSARSGAGQASALAVNYAREHAKLMLPWAGKEAPSEAREGVQDPPKAVRSKGSGPVAVDESASLPDAGSNFFTSLRYMGQLDRTYLLCEADGELVMLDQHAAHERVELDKLLRRYRERSIPVQRLLFPQTIELSAEQAAAADAHGDQLAAMGFEIDEFGGSGGQLSYALKAVPAGLRHAEPPEVLLDLLDELARRGSGRAVDEMVESMLATVACHSVVRAGDSLSGREVESLLSAMDGIDFRGVAPHGRPVLLRISVGEIARRFGR